MEKVLITKELRLRIIDLEYKGLPINEYIKEIERIYIEEIGEPLPAKVNIFKSSESKALLDDFSGYDGSAIHFSSKDNKINEVYIISEGSQDWADWEYNIQGLFAGMDYSQAWATNLFTQDALKAFGFKQVESNQEYEIPVIGLSHSLAHNNNATAHLAYDTFTKIFSVNGAQTNYYQLFRIDELFQERLYEIYPRLRRSRDNIIHIDPKALEKIAQDFYKDKAKNIYQDISLDDPLYAVSGIRGFFSIGHIEAHDTNKNLPGLRELVDQINDDDIKMIQKLAIEYSIASKAGGMEQVLKDLVGIDLEFVEKFEPIHYITKGDELAEMIHKVNEKLPELLEIVQLIISNADAIFSSLMDANYITKEQKAELIDVFQNLEKDLLDIQNAINITSLARDPENFSASSFSFTIGADLGTIWLILGKAKSFLKYLELLKKEEYVNLANQVIASHGIQEMLESLSVGNKRYIGDDLHFRSSRGATNIWVNISAALEMYAQGKVKLEQKKEAIQKFTWVLDHEIYDFYERKKTETIRKIERMEQNPNAYKSMFANYGFGPRWDRSIVSLKPDYDMQALQNVDMDYELNLLHESIERGYALIENSRKAIESLFDVEMNIAQRFDLMEGFYDGR